MSRKVLCSVVAFLLVASVSLASEAAKNNNKKHPVCAEGVVKSVTGDTLTIQPAGEGKEPVTLDCKGVKIRLHNANNNNNTNNVGSANNNNNNENNNANKNNNNNNAKNNANNNTSNAMTLADLVGKQVKVYGDDSNGKCVPHAIVIQTANTNNNNVNNNNSNNNNNTPRDVGTDRK